MDNIIFKKIWQDNNIIELEISVKSKLVIVYQNCYVEDKALLDISEKMQTYIRNYSDRCYLEFGKKHGNYSPAFSMDILPANNYGHIKIEVDIEIADNDTRSHRCCFFVNSELGLVDRLSNSLKNLVYNQIGEKVSLLDE